MYHRLYALSENGTGAARAIHAASTIKPILMLAATTKPSAMNRNDGCRIQTKRNAADAVMLRMKTSAPRRPRPAYTWPNPLRTNVRTAAIHVRRRRERGVAFANTSTTGDPPVIAARAAPTRPRCRARGHGVVRPRVRIPIHAPTGTARGPTR